MCGICGFLGDPSGVDTNSMIGVIQHRGPDDMGIYVDRFQDAVLWFGHRRLSILDLSEAGRQPMSTHDGTLTIIHNGEIYNFQEIRAELEAYGCNFISTSDTEVILYAWHRWGPKCLNRLRGMFAFAIWDRTERSLWLVRDRMGEKPLYYLVSPKRVVFSSEVRAILSSNVVERRMDSDGLDAYLTFGSVADPYTLVEGVKAVEAGHYVRICNGDVRSIPYWSLKDIPEGSSAVDRTESIILIRRQLHETLKLCMVSDVPVAILLSGGIDSSSNVVLLSEQGYPNLQTFSVIFEGPDAALSEEPWSTLIAERYKTQHTKVVVNEAMIREWVQDAIDAMDQPTFDGINTYLVCRAIYSAGIKVAISGQGADELFLGYSKRHLFSKLLNWAKIPFPSWLTFGFTRLFAYLTKLHDTKYEKVLQSMGTRNPLLAAYVASHSVFSQQAIERLRGSKRPLQIRFVRDQGGASALGKLSRLELTHYLRNTLLRDADQMSMAHSIELRAPFVDYKLVESVIALPTSLKVVSNRQKPLLVDAVGKGLPDSIVTRPKQGFSLPYDRWLRSGLVMTDISSVNLGLDNQEIENVKNRFESGQPWSRYWTLQILAAWAQRERMSPPKD